jgi:hypothetical protein
LGKAEADTEAETAETETARYPRVQKIQHTQPVLDIRFKDPVERKNKGWM